MRKPLKLALLFTFFLALNNCSKEDNEIDNNFTEEKILLFQSGFESNCQIQNIDSATDDIIGKDNSLSSKNDWVAMENLSEIVFYETYYQSGNSSQRILELLPDPKNSNNQVASLSLTETNVLYQGNELKGRIQSRFKTYNGGLKHIIIEEKIMFNSGFELLKNFSNPFTFLTIQEYFNTETINNEEYKCRTKLNIVKPNSGYSELYFRASGQVKEPNDQYDTFKVINLDYPIPFNEWLTITTELIEGDDDNGRVIIKIKKEGDDNEVTLFDEITRTVHPLDTQNNGFSSLNPTKIYTDPDIINYVKNNQNKLQLYWDDFKLYKE